MVGLVLRRSLALVLLAGCSPGPAPGATVTTPPPSGEHEHAKHESAEHGHAEHQSGHHRHHRFEDAQAWAKKFDDPARDAWQRPEAVIDFIAPAADAVIADLGAGTGYFAIPLARRVPEGRVLANDIEPDMVRYLGERAQREGLTNIVPVQGQAGDPALPEPVDIAFMCNVYHHIQDRVGFFGRVVDGLRPGGRVVIVELRKDAPEDVPGPGPAMRVDQQTLIAELAEAGLTLNRADRELLPRHYVVEFVPSP